MKTEIAKDIGIFLVAILMCFSLTQPATSHEMTGEEMVTVGAPTDTLDQNWRVSRL